MTIAPEPVLDPALAYPPVGAAQAGLRAADWPAVQAAFSGASSAYERHLIVTAAGELESSEDFLEAVVQRDRSDVLAATLLAAREVRIGWTLRGSGRGETVDAGMARGFRGHLARAEQLLIEACARDPRFVAAWGVRLITARGLELGPGETRRRYDRLNRHSPNDLSAQSALLQALVPKWGGTWETAHSFVWSCTTEAPPGAPNGCVVVGYHLERWLEDKRIAREVFADPQVRQEIWTAGEASVMNPAFTGAPGWVVALSQFALAYSLMGDWPRARHCFTRLGRFASRSGWEYFDTDVAKVFNTQREEAMRQG
jgi:hypothetical protein